MGFKNALKKKEYQQKYNKKYYIKNRKKLLKYRKSRKIQSGEAWKKWYEKRQNEVRKEKIQEGTVYSERKFNPYAS